MLSSDATMASAALQYLLKMEGMLHSLSDSAECNNQHLLQRFFVLIQK